MAWSDQTTRKEERLKRREKKVRKRQWLKAQVGTANERPKVAGGKRNRAVEDIDDDGDDDDWEELKREERMAKRLKKGEITQEEFDAEFAGLA